MKTVFITGASGAIGTACANLFQEKNYNIIYHYNTNAEKATEFFSKSFRVGDKKLELLKETAVSEDDIVLKSGKKSISIYISIPFCPSRCSYCSFVSHSVERAANLIPEYLDYLIKEINLTSEIVKLLNQMPNYNTRSNITSLTIANVYEIIYLLQKNMKKYDGKYVPKLEKALAFMRENDKYSIPQLAAYCGMSERCFYTTFKQFTGVTPIQMKHKIQGTKAEQLLKNTHLSVEEIANEVGFASETHFRKIFKKQCSYLPKDIRKK